MKTAALTLLSVLMLSAQTNYSTEVHNGKVFITAHKSIEVIYYHTSTYSQWDFRLEEPTLKVGDVTVTSMRGGTGFEVLSVAYSDGDYEGSQEAHNLVQMRRDMLAGMPIYPDKCKCGGVTTLEALKHMYKQKYPNNPPPMVVTGSESDESKAIPLLFQPWWSAGSMTVIGTVDGIPEPNNRDWAGNPESLSGCVGPCSVYVSTKASCPYYPPQVTRPFINASYSGGTNCYIVDINYYSYAIYGPSGLGSTNPAQRYGIVAAVETTGGPMGATYAAMTDSCFWSYPTYTSPGGGGPCN